MSNNKFKIGLIVMALMASFVAGASCLFYASPLSPLIVAGGVAVIGMCIAWLRKPVWALYAAIFVVLLPAGLIPSGIQSLLNRSTVVLAFSVWLLDTATQRRRIVWTNTTLLALGFIIWGIITLSWTPNLALGLESVGKYVLRLILYLILIVNEIDTKEALDGLMGTLALSGWVLVLTGAGTILSQGYQAGIRLQVISADENEFGVFTLVTMSGVLWLAIQSSGWQKALRMVLSILFILLNVVLVSLSGSRGSAISLFTTLLLFWFWKPTRPWGKLGLFILAIVAVSAPFVLTTVLDRFLVREGGVLGGRLTIWRAGWHLISDHFWGGVGIGNASYAVMPYLGKLTSVVGRERRSIHNPVLHVWAETGIPGMLLFLGTLVSAVVLFVRYYFSSNKTRTHALTSYFALISSVLAGYMLSFIKSGGLLSGPTYYLVLALLLIPSRLEANSLVRVMTRNAKDTN